MYPLAAYMMPIRSTNILMHSSLGLAIKRLPVASRIVQRELHRYYGGGTSSCNTSKGDLALDRGSSLAPPKKVICYIHM